MIDGSICCVDTDLDDLIMNYAAGHDYVNADSDSASSAADDHGEPAIYPEAHETRAPSFIPNVELLMNPNVGTRSAFGAVTAVRSVPSDSHYLPMSSF